MRWRGQPLTLAAVRRAAGCYCAAAIHATGKREPLEDLTDGAARSRSIEESGNDISGRQVWTELA
jgi:hypothetical protein